jgi:hypothetical protein
MSKDEKGLQDDLTSQAWWCTPVIPALGRLRGGKIRSSKPAWARVRLSQKQIKISPHTNR